MTLTDLGNHEIKKSKNCKNYLYIFHSLVSTKKPVIFLNYAEKIHNTFIKDTQ